MEHMQFAVITGDRKYLNVKRTINGKLLDIFIYDTPTYHYTAELAERDRDEAVAYVSRKLKRFKRLLDKLEAEGAKSGSKEDRALYARTLRAAKEWTKINDLTVVRITRRPFREF